MLCPDIQSWIINTSWKYTSGIQTNIFSPGASWAPKIRLLGAQPKAKGPGFGRKLNSFKQNSFALPIPSKSVFLNNINYMYLDQLNLTNLTYILDFQRHAGPLIIQFKGPSPNFWGTGLLAPVSLFSCTSTKMGLLKYFIEW